MHNELESLRQQILQHQLEIILRSVSGNLRYNVVSLSSEPAGSRNPIVLTRWIKGGPHNAVRHFDYGFKSHIGVSELPGVVGSRPAT